MEIKGNIILKECPFCKTMPSVCIESIKGYDPCHDYFVACKNPKCKIRPSTKKYNDIYDSDLNKCIQNAIEDWNDRGEE